MGCAPQGQRTLKCYYQRTSGEPLYEQGRIRGFSRRFGDCSGSTVFAALPDRRLVLTPEIRACLGLLADSVSSFPSTRKCPLALSPLVSTQQEPLYWQLLGTDLLCRPSEVTRGCLIRRPWETRDWGRGRPRIDRYDRHRCRHY